MDNPNRLTAELTTATAISIGVNMFKSPGTSLETYLRCDMATVRHRELLFWRGEFSFLGSAESR